MKFNTRATKLLVLVTLLLLLTSRRLLTEVIAAVCRAW